MTETARLVVEADTTSVRRASDDLKEFSGTAAPAAAKASDQYRQEVSRANNETGIFGKGVGALKANILALAGTMTVGVFTSWIKGAIDAADATGKAAQSAGLALDEYTKLDMAFALGAGEGANLALAMNRLSTEAAGSAEKLAALGIQATDANGDLRSSYQIMLDVADQFKNMEDGAEKTAIAVDIFGRSGQSLIPMLNQGRKGMEEAGAAAAKVSENLYKMSEAANDNVTVIGGLFSSLSNEIAERLLPRMNDMLEWAIKFGPTLKPVLEILGTLAGPVLGLVSFAFKSVMTTLSLVTGAFNTLMMTIGMVGTVFSNVINGDFDKAKQALIEYPNIIGDVASKSLDQLIALWDDDANAAKANQDKRTKQATEGEIERANAYAKSLLSQKQLEQQNYSDRLMELKNYSEVSKLARAETDKLIEKEYAEHLKRMAAIEAKESPKSAKKLAAAPAAPKASDGINPDLLSSLAQDLVLEDKYRAERMAKKQEEEQFYTDLESMRLRDKIRYAAEDAAAHQKAEDDKRKASQQSVTALGRLLEQGASKSRTVAKMQQRFNAVMAASQIAKDTPVAASGARAALSMIPIVGPALGQAAYFAIMGSGAALAASVLGSSSSTTPPTGGGASIPSAGGSSLSQNTVQPAPVNSPNIILRLIGGARRYTVEEVAELMEDFGERLADNGGRIGKVQVQVA